MEHFNGDQSNDHRHQLKLFGFYQFNPQWGASANFSLISGAPQNCLGNYYGTEYSGRDPAGYGGSAITGGRTTTATTRKPAPAAHRRQARRAAWAGSPSSTWA
ncbi:hypothetical protein BJD12_08055 [Xanthomonas vesicatoria ATCC 35937]|nr:hypothetical protein BJD12_08055 [Xanthomonas vesicatoria ATCC 35937]